MYGHKWTVWGLNLVILILLAIQSASAISCFRCNSKMDPGCDILPVNSKYMIDCSELKNGSKFDRCRKTLQWVDKEMEGMKPDHRVIRDCGWPQGDDERDCYYRAGFGGRVQVCSCTSDNCNAATKTGSTNMPIIGLFTTLAVYIVKFIH